MKDQPANRDPLAKVAKAKLKEVGETPDDNQFYPLQLMLWATDKGGFDPGRERWGMQQEALYYLQGQSPEKVLSYLTEGGPGERMDQPEVLAKLKPMEVVADLFQMLHLKMLETQPDYQPRTPD